MHLITARFLCTGVVDWNLAQPLIQQKDCNCPFTSRTEEYMCIVVSIAYKNITNENALQEQNQHKNP